MGDMASDRRKHADPAPRHRYIETSKVHVLYGSSYAGSILITCACVIWRAPVYSGSPAGPPIEQLELQRKATPSDRRKNRPLEKQATPAHHASGSEKARARAVSSAALFCRYFGP